LSTDVTLFFFHWNIVEEFCLILAFSKQEKVDKDMQIGLYEPLLTFAATKTGPFFEFLGQMLPILLQLQFTQKCNMQLFVASYEFFYEKMAY
jgi:hypothetical protein